MLFFFFLAAKKRKFLGIFPSTNSKCPSCNEKAFLKISFYQSYMRFYYIPTFPLKKVAKAQCSNCGYDEKINRKNESLKREIYFLKDRAKTPVWTWTGSVIFVLLIWGLVFFLIKNSKEEKLRASEPQTEDIYYFEDDMGLYTSFLLEKVSSDSLWFCPNKNKIKLGGKVKRRHLGHEFDNTDTLIFSKLEILLKYQNDEFKRIERKD